MFLSEISARYFGFYWPSDRVTHQSLSKCLWPTEHKILNGEPIPAYPWSRKKSALCKTLSGVQGRMWLSRVIGKCLLQKIIGEILSGSLSLDFFFNSVSDSYTSFLITFLILFAASKVISSSQSGGGLICVPSIGLHNVITDNYILHTCTQCNPRQQSAVVERNLTFLSSPSSKFEGNTYVIQ